MTTSPAAASFVDKWRARWPEWSLAMVFVPAAQRDLVVAWFALLQELTDAAWNSGDPAPGLAKLAWWQEELQGWAKGAWRHPLGAALHGRSAPWSALARALTALQAGRLHPGASMQTAPDAFAQAVADCEAALFESDDAQGAAAPVAASLAAEHALAHPQTAAAAPIAWPALRAATRPRRMHAALQSARLRGAGSAPSPWRALFAAWRAARDGRDDEPKRPAH